MTVEEAIRAALRYPELANEAYEARGIFNSEMALAIGTCADRGIEVILESGRARGQSTYLLAKYLPNVKVCSIERFRDDDALFCERRLEGFNNVTLFYGDGRSLIPSLLNVYEGQKIAVIMDGPKGHPALELLESVKASVEVGFIHDMRKMDHGGASSFRLEAEKWPGAFFTDDPDYVDATKHMDAPVVALGIAANWKPHYIGNEYIGSYGPTLGVFPCSP